MKEIRAFIRQHRIADVLQALRESGLCDLGTAGAGCHNITVSQVQRPLASGDPTQQHYSMELACPDEAADALVDVIARAGHTGQAEAGWIFVSDIQRAIEIR